MSFGGVTAPQKEGRQKRSLGDENETPYCRATSWRCSLRLTSCVRCEGGSVVDMWCCDFRRYTTYLGSWEVPCWLPDMHRFLIGREMHIVSPAKDHTQIGHSRCLEPQLPVPALEALFRKASVTRTSVAALTLYYPEAKPKLVVMF